MVEDRSHFIPNSEKKVTRGVQRTPSDVRRVRDRKKKKEEKIRKPRDNVRRLSVFIKYYRRGQKISGFDVRPFTVLDENRNRFKNRNLT